MGLNKNWGFKNKNYVFNFLKNNKKEKRIV